MRAEGSANIRLLRPIRGPLFDPQGTFIARAASLPVPVFDWIGPRFSAAYLLNVRRLRSFDETPFRSYRGDVSARLAWG
jgi:hypothetical protein